jgi:transglutaminase-like putative cysteine protease
VHFRIVHSIRYSYSQPVFLEPHELRMQPRNCGNQILRAFDVNIEPAPAGISSCLDAEGNHLSIAWFDGLHRQLTVVADSHIETLRTNPFDYLLPPGDVGLPLRYVEPNASMVESACQRRHPQDECDTVTDFADRLQRASDGRLLGFLNHLNQTIHSNFRFIRREDGMAWPPAQTLRDRRGACRDFALLFVETCRSKGIAARFVSGYQEGNSSVAPHDLHAWAEVYVPGGGWRGYDPSSGLAVADRHVAVAASVTPSNTSPVRGSLRGTDVTATMQTRIELNVGPCPPWTFQLVQQQQQ